MTETRVCNSHVTTGCGDHPRTISVTGSAFNLTVDPLTHTVYVANVDS